MWGFRVDYADVREDDSCTQKRPEVCPLCLVSCAWFSVLVPTVRVGEKRNGKSEGAQLPLSTAWMRAAFFVKSWK